MTDDIRKTAEPATAKAYRALERMIVTLELQPGVVTTEGALIDRLGLGRTPVREAIQRLAWEGLISVKPRAGLAVAPLDPGDWCRVVEARRGVEIVLARSAAKHASANDCEGLQSAAHSMHQAVLAGDVEAFLEADKLLDEEMAAMAANPFAVRLAGPLQTHSRRFWFRYQRETGLARAAERHVALLQAIIGADMERAGQEAGRLMDLLAELAETVSREN